MRIERLHVEGFGVHRDLHLEFGPGLNVLLGPNEAGKSTLHAFVLAVFFGLGKKDEWLPSRGGRHGGALTLARRGEHTRIERVFSPRKSLRVVGPRGEEGGEEMLAEILGKVDAKLYRSVFGFDLEDLQKLPLGSDEIERHLFDAGLLGAGKSLVGLRKELRDVMDRLHRPRSGPIWDGYRSIRAQRRTLEELVERSRAHGERLGREATLEEEIAKARARRRTLEIENRRWHRLLDLWPFEVKRRSLEARLEELGPTSGNEAALYEALLHHDRLREREQALRNDLDRLAADHEEIVRALGAIALDEALLSLEPRLSALEEERAFVEEARESVAALGRSIAQRDDAIAALTASFGEGWSLERALGVDRSLARREALEARAAALRRAEQALDEAARRTEAAQATLEDRERELEAARAAVAAHGDVPTAEAIELRTRALAGLRAAQAERERLAQREVTEAAGASGPTLARIGATALLALVGAALFFVDRPIAGLLVLAAGLGLAWVWGRRGRAGAGEGLWAAIERCERDLRAHAEVLGLLPSFGAGEIEGAAMALEGDRKRRDRHDDLVRAVEEREGAARAARAAWEAARAREEEARGAWVAAEAAWRAACAELFGGVDGARAPGPEAARERLERLERIANLWEARESERKEKERLEARLHRWRESATSLLASAGRDVLEGDLPTLRVRLAELRRAIEETREGVVRRRNLLEQKAKLERERERLQEQLDALATELARCLEEQGVDGREALAARLEQERTREQLRQELQGIENAFLEQMGEGEEAERIRSLLSEGRRDVWEVERARTGEAIERLTEAIEVLQQELAITQAERKREEDSEAIPELEEQIEDDRVVWATLVQRYRRASALELLLDEALEELQEARQPAVLRSASAFFRTVTEDRYVQIRQVAEDAKVEVIRPHGAAIAAGQLSRGTREQLYLCLRLGLADAFAEQGVKLPILMDDVLVNFDPERARGMARVLVEVADRHQILLFTCHPATAELLAQEAGAACIPLPRPDASEPPAAAAASATGS